MQRPQLVMSAALGLLAGAGLAGLGLWLGHGRVSAQAASPAPTVATTAPEEALEAWWAAPDEVVLGPTVLVPSGIEFGDGELILAYDLVDIAPPPIGLPGPNAAHTAAAPELWTLLTTGGEPITAATTAPARTVRFAVPDDFDPSTVVSARIDAWRVRLPATHRLEIAHDDQAEHTLEPGTTVALRLILPQPQNTLVQFRVEHPADGFSGGATSFSAAFEAQPAVRGLGPGWTNVGITETGTQLTYVGGELPDPFRVEVDTHEWWTVDEPVEVDLTGVVRG